MFSEEETPDALIASLRLENANLARENEILKKSLADLQRQQLGLKADVLESEGFSHKGETFDEDVYFGGSEGLAPYPDSESSDFVVFAYVRSRFVIPKADIDRTLRMEYEPDDVDKTRSALNIPENLKKLLLAIRFAFRKTENQVRTYNINLPE